LDPVNVERGVKDIATETNGQGLLPWGRVRQKNRGKECYGTKQKDTTEPTTEKKEKGVREHACHARIGKPGV